MKKLSANKNTGNNSITVHFCVSVDFDKVKDFLFIEGLTARILQQKITNHMQFIQLFC